MWLRRHKRGMVRKQDPRKIAPKRQSQQSLQLLWWWTTSKFSFLMGIFKMNRTGKSSRSTLLTSSLTLLGSQFVIFSKHFHTATMCDTSVHRHWHCSSSGKLIGANWATPTSPLCSFQRCFNLLVSLCSSKGFSCNWETLRWNVPTSLVLWQMKKSLPPRFWRLWHTGMSCPNTGRRWSDHRSSIFFSWCPNSNFVEMPDVQETAKTAAFFMHRSTRRPTQWGRRYQMANNAATPPQKADQFQAYLRVSHSALGELMVTNVMGIYMEPRSETLRGSHEDYAVVWLPNHTREEAIHRLKMTSGCLSIVRFRLRYGIRTKADQEANVYALLRPDDTFVKVKVTQTWRIHPLPFGVQKQAVQKILGEWNWEAKVLQPLKGTQHGSAWEIGADAPPSCNILQAYGKDVLVTIVKNKEKTKDESMQVVPRKTQQYLRTQAPSTTPPVTATTPVDPWQNYKWDPWAKKSGATPVAEPVKKRIEEVTEQLRSNVKEMVQSEVGASSSSTSALQESAERRFVSLESNMREMQVQNQKLSTWFQEANNRMASSEQQMQVMSTAIEKQNKDLCEVKTEVKQSIEATQTGLQGALIHMKQDLADELGSAIQGKLDTFTNHFEAMMSKKMRTDWLGHSGLSTRRGTMPGRVRSPTFFYRALWCLLLWVNFGFGFATDPLEQAQHARNPFFPPACSHREYVMGNVPAGSVDTDLGTDGRIGEAANPGPSASWHSNDVSSIVRIGCNNPSGLRRKETEAVGLGPGIWGFSETQLSQVTMLNCKKSLKSLARQENRQIWVGAGAAVHTRATSQWAGSWSGVLVLSDYKSRAVALPWPSGMFESGRVCTTHHMIQQTQVMVTTLYGFPRGPTYPEAKSLTGQMVDFLFKEIILGSSGPRIIMGDYNFTATELPGFQQWRQFGWESAQTHAQKIAGWVPLPTSKGKKERDLIWLSPEALRMMVGIHHTDVFAEHSTLAVDLLVPSKPLTLWSWPKPQCIPWQQVDSQWTSTVAPEWTSMGTSTDQYKQFWSSFENELEHHLKRPQQSGLSSNEKGRGQRLQPLHQQQTPPMTSASRPGEVVLRSDITGNAVRAWFRQLRRLQSLLHSVRAAKSTSEALTHRLELWSSIVYAKGFKHGFRSWWAMHRISHLGEGPALLPIGVPDLSIMENIFQTFKSNFERFESWHLRHRGKLLAQKHDKSMRHLFQDLRDPKKGQPTLLYHTKDLQIQSIENNNVCSLDSQPLSGEIQTWSINGLQVEAELLQDDSCKLDEELLIQPGASLQQTVFLHTTDTIQKSLVDHWLERWQSRTPPTTEEWTRMLQFFQAHMPTIQLEAPPLTSVDWRRMLKKYKATAARGLDGVSHEDLKAMPDSYLDRLLHLLRDVETGTTTWPRQLLKGLCIPIAKLQQAHEVGHYRPIVILSLVYRTWGACRARQMIRQLAPYAKAGQFGFLPGHEPLELWMSLQASIETAIDNAVDMQGLTTDLIKAFNYVPRDFTEALAEHLGMPNTILQPWMAFLQNFERAFLVDSFISPFVTSTAGLPEGDSLSVYGMIQLDMAFHQYMAAFCPSVKAFSYVDNLMLSSRSPADLIGGWSALLSFFEMWNLTTDPKKTYAWGLSTSSRAALKQIQLPISLHGSELGGAMTFGLGYSTKHFELRAASLHEKWQRLHRSSAPLHQRLRSLYLIFWPKALHGTNAVPVANGFLARLRTDALRALRLSKAGTNSMIRLSVSSDPRCDPGFFLLTAILRDFIRLCGKDGGFLDRWIHSAGPHGKSKAGPFKVLLEQLNSIGWRVDPPLLLDHDGISFNILTGDQRDLEYRLHEGWAQYVSTRINTRHTLKDLDGIDHVLANKIVNKGLPYEDAILASIQSGTFFADGNTSKFDLSKEAKCSFCGNKNTHDHWLDCQGYVQHRPSNWPVDLDLWPTSLRSHLIPSRNPHIHTLRHALDTLPEGTGDFLSAANGEVQHLFTDGSLFDHEQPMLRKASWAVLNATTGLPVSSACVSGLCQTIDVAELMAVVSALQWTLVMGCKTHLWLDSKFVADALDFVLFTGVVPEHWSNRRLWGQVLELLEQMPDRPPHIHWIPSHVPVSSRTDPFMDWWAMWNDRVDNLAVQQNQQRTRGFSQLWQAAAEFHHDQKHRLQVLAEFYVNVAQAHSSKQNAILVPEDTLVTWDLEYEPLLLRLPNAWQDVLRGGLNPTKVSIVFCVQLVQKLITLEDSDVGGCTISFLELVFVLLGDTSFGFPFLTQTSEWQICRPQDRFERPTVAYLVTTVKNALRQVLGCLEIDGLIGGLDRLSLGCFVTLDGILLGLSRHTLEMAQRRVRDFTGRRPYRKACDLARPA